MRSLAFRGWALAVAEVARTVADMCSSVGGGWPILRQAKYYRVLRQLLNFVLRGETRALLHVVYLHWRWWNFADAYGEDGRHGALVVPRSGPARRLIEKTTLFHAWQHYVAAERGSTDAIAARMHSRRRIRLNGTIWQTNIRRNAVLVCDAFTLWRSAMTASHPCWSLSPRGEQRAHDAHMRSLFTEGAALRRAVKACRHSAIAARMAFYDARLLPRMWAAWSRRPRAARRAEQLRQSTSMAVLRGLTATTVHLWKMQTHRAQAHGRLHSCAGNLHVENNRRSNLQSCFTAWHRGVLMFEVGELRSMRIKLEASLNTSLEIKGAALLKNREADQKNFMTLLVRAWKGQIIEDRTIRQKIVRMLHNDSGAAVCDCFTSWSFSTKLSEAHNVKEHFMKAFGALAEHSGESGMLYVVFRRMVLYVHACQREALNETLEKTKAKIEHSHVCWRRHH